MPKISEIQVLRSLCRDSLKDFVREFWHAVVPGEKLVWNWHIPVMCDELQACYERVFRGEPKKYDLVTNIPPGTTKSLVHSVMAPAWAWTRMPNLCYIGASYGHNLALDLARKNRDVVDSELYRACFPEIVLRLDQNTKAYFMNTLGGQRCSVGSKGIIIGMHAHVIGIDDPLDPNVTNSEAEIFSVNEWIQNTLFQRKKDSQVSFVDLVMQRLHQDDPAARMIKGGRCRHVCLPATTDHPVRPPAYAANYEDGLLDPVRLPRTVLEDKRRVNALGEAGYNGQYGQSPVPPGGGKFKVDRLRWGPRPEKYKRVVRFWDKAASPQKRRSRASWTVGVKMAEDFDGGVWVLNVRRGRWDSAERERVIRRTAVADGKGVVVAVEQEPGSGGKDSALATVRRLKGWRVVVLPARGSKELRADEFSVQVNNGNVYIPESFRDGDLWAGWAADYVDELRHWPVSTYKDQGDASGGAFTVLARPVRYAGPARGKGKRVAGAPRFG